MVKPKALGKGLSALIPEGPEIAQGEGEFFHCPIEAIEPNPLQPRQRFKEQEIQELADSIREKGVLTPLLVSRAERGYRLIAGERRWRAAQKAGLKRVPVVIRESTPTESLELALIENIHRSDLNPLEEAQAYSRWLEDTKTTQEMLAKRLGKDRSTITNTLRLLKLPRVIQEDLIEDRLTMGHARVLAGLKTEEEQLQLRDRILKGGLSVRQAESRAKTTTRPRKEPRPTDTEKANYLLAVADELKRSLGTKVEIKESGGKGTVVLHFYSDEELGRLIEKLGG